jgi:hypothetical protein
MDHIGFTVEDMQAFKSDVDDLIDRNPVMNPPPVGRGVEGQARLGLLKKQCPIAEHFLSDPDYTMLAVRERH